MKTWEAEFASNCIIVNFVPITKFDSFRKSLVFFGQGLSEHFSKCETIINLEISSWLRRLHGPKKPKVVSFLFKGRRAFRWNNFLNFHHLRGNQGFSTSIKSLKNQMFRMVCWKKTRQAKIVKKFIFLWLVVIIFHDYFQNNNETVDRALN